jgi:hypothetical protein
LDDQKVRFIARGVRIPVFAWFTWPSGRIGYVHEESSAHKLQNSPTLGANRCRRASSVQAASITAPLRCIKLTSPEVLEGGASVLRPLMHSRDTGGRRRPPERKNLPERAALLSFLLCEKVRQLTEQPRRACGHRGHEDKRDKRHLGARQAGLRSTCRHSRRRLCATLRPVWRHSSKSQSCRR